MWPRKCSKKDNILHHQLLVVEEKKCCCYMSYVCGVAIKECSGSGPPEKLIVEMMAWGKYLHIELLSDGNVYFIQQKKTFSLLMTSAWRYFSVHFLRMSTWFEIEISFQFPRSIKSQDVALGELPYSSWLGQTFPHWTCISVSCAFVFLLHVYL